MCGIVGCFLNSTAGTYSTDHKAMRNLITADAVRGYDGTGMFFYQKEKGDDEERLFFYKKAVAGTAFMGSTDFANMVSGSRFIVAHNRAATMGEIDDSTTHPFNYGPITGVHNGTVHGWRSILSDHITAATMDSQAIFEALADIDPDPEAVGKLLGKLECGAYSLVWWDNRVKKLRFARNDDRPMNFVRTPRGFYFGSELRMLEWVLDRNKMSIIDSTSTRIHTLIDVPVDGTAAEYHDFSNEVDYYAGSRNKYYGNYGTGYPANQWDSTWWDDDVPFDNAQSWRTQNTTPRKQLIVNPNDIRVLELDRWTESRVEHGVRYMTGTTSLSPHRDLRFSDGLRMIFAKDEKDVSDSSTMATADVHIIDLYNTNVPIAYVELSDGDVEPATFIGSLDAIDPNGEIKDVLDRGNVAVIECPVIGVYAYAPGQLAYAVGTPHNAQLRELTGAEVAKDLGSGYDAIQRAHPEIMLRANNFGWHFGWMNK